MLISFCLDPPRNLGSAQKSSSKQGPLEISEGGKLMSSYAGWLMSHTWPVFYHSQSSQYWGKRHSKGHNTLATRKGSPGSAHSCTVKVNLPFLLQVTKAQKSAGPGSRGLHCPSWVQWSLFSIYGETTSFSPGVSTAWPLLVSHSNINKLALSAWSFSWDPWTTLCWQHAIFCSIQHVCFFIVIHVWVSFESNYCISLMKCAIWLSR